MRLPIKMYFIIFIGASSLILYQYHLSTAWILTHPSPEIVESYSYRQDNRNYSVTSLPCVKQSSKLEEKDVPRIYIITPTYKRPEQIAELTRLSHTLMLIRNVFWLVIEDAEEKNPYVTELLKKTGLPFEHLTAPMPQQYKNRKKGPKPRGVSNRNRGLQWIKENAKDGVLYFADDDNTYDLELFQEIRATKKVSMWPVGLITKLGVSTPIVKNGKFVGFYDGWIAGRKFPVDMAGFAVSVKFLLQRPKALMPFKPGFEEDGFLKSLAPFEPKDIELLASKCTKEAVCPSCDYKWLN